MNTRERRRLAVKAIDILMEVVEDVLQEAYDNNEGGLSATHVAAKAGFPNVGDRGHLSRYVLDRLRNDGIAIDDQPGPGHGFLAIGRLSICRRMATTDLCWSTFIGSPLGVFQTGTTSISKVLCSCWRPGAI